MQIVFTDNETFQSTRKKMAALPAGLQSDVYGDGFYQAAKKVARKAKRLVQVGEDPPVTTKGKPRRRLRDSIRAIRVAWHWGGEKVNKSAAIVVAEQPHAHLLERGTVRMKEGPYPFLEPPTKDGTLTEAFRQGTNRSFQRLVKRLESGKLRARERRAFKR